VVEAGVIDLGTGDGPDACCVRGRLEMRLAERPGGREDVGVADASADSLCAELALLAASFVLPYRGLDVNRAIRVACDLLVRDLDTPATVAVAGLAYGTTQGDAEPVIRDMLHEQGFPADGPGAGGARELITVLRAVAANGMQIGEFFTFFMRLVPAWEQQDELQRRLVVLLDDWQGETTPQGRSATAAALRQVAADAVGDAS
jgi:hypothetical protein